MLAEKQSHLKWVYEHIVEAVPLLRRFPARRAVLVQLAGMEAVALAAAAALGLGWALAIKGSLVVLAVGLWSELLVAVAPAIRALEPASSGRAGRVLGRYRRLVFHPRHLELIPGLAVLATALWAFFPPAGSRGGLGAILAGHIHPAAVGLVILLAWDVAYRQGVAGWVTVLSAWRARRLARVLAREPEFGDARPDWLFHFRRLDERLLYFPLINLLLVPAILPDRTMLRLVGGGTLVTLAALLAALHYDGRVWRLWAAVSPPPSRLRGWRERHRLPWPASAGYHRLGPEAHVAIVGAGPAGTFAAHFLRQHAARAGMSLTITMFDAKDFAQRGPPGCNMCAGVISAALLQRLEEKGFRLPADKVQSRVGGFDLHTRAGLVRLDRTEPKEQMVTVFRGNGPRHWTGYQNVSFDDFLLDAVRGDDLTLVNEPVLEVRIPRHTEQKPVVVYGRGQPKHTLEPDLVVLACGVDGGLARRLGRAGFGYRPPPMLRACQAELHLGDDYVEQVLGNRIHIFSQGLPGIAFVALVPKGEFVSISVVGDKDIGLDDLLMVLDTAEVRACLPEGWRLPEDFCHCHPHLVTGASFQPFADRVVVIGDASCCRLYKNGIESAFNTAAFAAHTTIERGISAEAFRDHYLPPCRRVIMKDNVYAQILFRLNHLIASHPLAARAYMEMARADLDTPVTRATRQALWELFTGSRPYREIFWRACSVRALGAFFRRLLAAVLTRGKPPRAPQ